MTYQHESRWQSCALLKSFDDFAKDLLETLSEMRQSQEEQERAIIFIGHSLGGLLIKQALIIAGAKGSPYKNISDRTTGVIFLGVPHLGSNKLLTFLGWLQATFCKLFGSRIDLLNLANRSPELDKLHHQFLSSYKDIDCICFYESIPEYILGISLGPTVDERSATISGNLHNIGLATDHRGLNKFQSREDQNYLKVLKRLKGLVDGAPEALKKAASKEGLWVVPYSQNKLFTGRQNISEQLRKILSGSGHRCAALWGLGGVGKSQIALEYIHQYVKSVRHMFWVHGASLATLSRDYFKISAKVGLPIAEEKVEETLLRLKDWFESDESSDWMLVVDNADDLSEFETNREGIWRYIPQGIKGALIVTTRSYAIANRLGCDSIEVPRMDRDEAKSLFQQHYKGSITENSTESDSIRNLLVAFDFLPLAIVGAASFMRETRTLPVEYFEMYNSTYEIQISLLAHGINNIQKGQHQGITESVLTTYYVTFRQIENLCPLAAALLRLIAFLDWQAIPQQLLQESGLDGATDPVVFRKAIGYLLDYSLITRGANQHSYNVHRLVHLSMQAYVSRDPGKANHWKKRVLLIVSELFPVAKYGNWPWDTCSSYLPHAITVLKHSDSRKWVTSILLSKVGRHMHLKGDNYAAVKYLEASIHIQINAGAWLPTSGPEHSGRVGTWCGQGNPIHAELPVMNENSMWESKHCTVEDIYILASAYARQGDYDKAHEWSYRALAVVEKSLGRDHPNTANMVQQIVDTYISQGDSNKVVERRGQVTIEVGNSLGMYCHDILHAVHNIGIVHSELGEYREALEWYRLALDGREKALGKDHPNTLQTIQRIGAAYRNLGEYREALQWYRLGLDGQEMTLGKDHPDTLSTMQHIGIVYSSLGEYREALEWSHRALDGQEKTLGKDDPGTSSTMFLIGTIYSSLGEYRKALKWSLRGLDGLEKIFGNGHPSTLTAMRLICIVYNGLSEYRQALEWCHRALDGQEKIFEKGDRNTFGNMYHIGNAYNSLGEYRKALECLHQALDGAAKIFEKDHPDTLVTMHNIGYAYSKLGKHREALEWYRRALDGQEKTLGKDHPNTLNTMKHIGIVYSSLGEYRKALKWSHRGLDGLEKIFGNDHPSTLTAMRLICIIYNGLGEYRQALEWCHRALDGQEKIFGKGDRNTFDTMYHIGNAYNGLGYAYSNLGKHREALEWYRRALDGQEKILGKNHRDTLHTVCNVCLTYIKLYEYKKALGCSSRAVHGYERIFVRLMLSSVKGFGLPRGTIESSAVADLTRGY
ncbi:hypothetical protein BDZ91DRAFT_786504 [Kalaharituber pfeilii]|nr:hypothetical protein BDZ91DRAFT_786504 [Kalaharituber pfeilii]